MPSSTAARNAEGDWPAGSYQRHRPVQTLLYQIVEQHCPAFTAHLAERGKELPGYVQREFEDYLKCGRLEHGFLRVRCESCHVEHLVAFSCKRRGFCPSCGARRMAESAALLVDVVFPEQPVRQWVLSTVTDSPIHAPSDSTLLWDSVRVLVRLLQGAEAIAEGIVTIAYRNHQRVAKKRTRAIRYTRGKDKKATLYRDLITVTQNTLRYVEQASIRLCDPRIDSLERAAWQAQLDHYKPLIGYVIDQTERRVFQGESVPAAQKIVSIFEDHTDIIVKGSRDVQYGHKINRSTGRSGLILDVVIEQGNPADVDRLLAMLDRHIDVYGKAPRQMAADGGYASVENLCEAKARDVDDVVFHKKRGLNVEDMAKSPWVYRKLRNFRAGIEAGISVMKRAYGLGRCTWKGLQHFRAYVWSSVVAHNLVVFGRLLAP